MPNVIFGHHNVRVVYTIPPTQNPCVHSNIIKANRSFAYFAQTLIILIMIFADALCRHIGLAIGEDPRKNVCLTKNNVDKHASGRKFLMVCKQKIIALS